MVNRVVLVGRLGGDPELRVTGSGHSVASMRLAVRRVRAQQGQQDTDWIDVVAWQKTAEYAANYLKKGYLISVDGRLQVREYETQAGEKRRAYEVVADSVQNLQPRDRTDNGGAAARPARPAPADAEPNVSQEIEDVFGQSDDDFDPFGDA